MIRWHDLLFCLDGGPESPAEGAPNPVAMPAGNVCRRIHPTRRRHYLVLDHHPRLRRHVCPEARDSDGVGGAAAAAAACGSTRFDEILFREDDGDGDDDRDSRPARATTTTTTTTTLKLQMDPWRLRIRRDGVGSEVRRRAASFVASMDAAMVAIGDADLSRVHAGTNNSLESVVASIESAPDYDWFWWDGRCELVYHLLVRSRPDLVLAGNAGGRWDLSATFATNFGSQAVGNFWSFLVSYMLRVYVGVNAVLAAKSLEGGGKFKQVVLPKLHQPESYVLSMVREDCDGRTFLHTERAALAEGTLFKDEEATRNMLKAVFRFMAGLYAVQRKHWGDARAREWWFSGEFGRLGYALVHLGTALSDS